MSGMAKGGRSPELHYLLYSQALYTSLAENYVGFPLDIG